MPVAQVQRFLPPSLRGGSGAEAALALYLAYAPRGMAEDDYFTARVFKAAIDLIDTLRQHQPFVLVVDGFDPHEPWDPPPAWARRFAGDNPLDYEPLHPFDAPISAMSQLGLSAAVAKRVQGLYGAELAFTDHWIGNLLGKVASAGLTDSTAVMYTSDHGVFLGERGLIGKSGRHLHKEMHHTPFIVKHPGRSLAGAPQRLLRLDERRRPDADVVPRRETRPADGRRGPHGRLRPHAQGRGRGAQIHDRVLRRLRNVRTTAAGCCRCARTASTSSCSTRDTTAARRATSPPPAPTSCAASRPRCAETPAARCRASDATASSAEHLLSTRDCSRIVRVSWMTGKHRNLVQY